MNNNDLNSKTPLLTKHINTLNKETQVSMKSRVIVSIIFVGITLPCLLFGGYFWLLYVLLLSIIACFEITRGPQSIEKKYLILIYIMAYIMLFTAIFYVCSRDLIVDLIKYFGDKGTLVGFKFSIWTTFKMPSLSLSSLCLCVFFFFLLVFIDKNFKVEDAFYFVVCITIVALGLQSLLYIRFLPYRYNGININNENKIVYSLRTCTLLLFVLIGVTLSDVGAYFSGVLFGKHKMVPNVSPKKTWEGFVGGIFLSTISSLLFSLLLCYFDQPLLEGVLDKYHIHRIFIVAFIIPLTSTFGDLFFSSIKRWLGIKDFGTIMKEHGGVLDRFDSIFLSCILVSLLLMLYIDPIIS